MSRAPLLVFLAALLLVGSTAQAAAGSVVVSQIYGGGGNAGAPFRNDYVELFNAGSTAVDLSGWTVQYATAAGTNWQVTSLSGTIAPGGYYLVELASNANVGTALPPADATGTSNLGGTAGKVALVRAATALTCGSATGTCSADPLVQDLVGYGDASDFEGSGSAPPLSNTVAAVRANAGCTDSGDNATDFTASPPAPRNTASPASSCASTPVSPSDGSVDVGLDLVSVLSLSLDHPSLGFGSVTSGDRPAPLPERVTVSSNDPAGYSLVVTRTAFAPTDLPLALAATAPVGAVLGSAVAPGALVPIPVAPATALTIGTKTAPTAAGGDPWPITIGFTSPLPLVATGRYSATVTFTAAGH